MPDCLLCFPALAFQTFIPPVLFSAHCLFPLACHSDSAFASSNLVFCMYFCLLSVTCLILQRSVFWVIHLSAHLVSPLWGLNPLRKKSECVISDKWAFRAMRISFQHNRLSDRWAFGPMGHFLDYWGVELMGCQNNSMAPMAVHSVSMLVSLHLCVWMHSRLLYVLTKNALT